MDFSQKLTSPKAAKKFIFDLSSVYKNLEKKYFLGAEK